MNKRNLLKRICSLMLVSMVGIVACVTLVRKKEND